MSIIKFFMLNSRQGIISLKIINHFESKGDSNLQIDSQLINEKGLDTRSVFNIKIIYKQERK